MIAHLLEDGLNTSGVWQVNLEFRTLLVFAALRRAFVCEHSAAVGDTHPNQFAVLAERALRVVEQGIRFQRARFCGMKTKLAQPSPDFSKLAGQAELDFDFDLQSDTLIHQEGKCQTAPTSGLAIALGWPQDIGFSGASPGCQKCL